MYQYFYLIYVQKEDVENALRTTNMSLQDALEILSAGRVSESWNRRQEEHSFDQSGASFTRGFNPGQQVSFPPVSIFLSKICKRH